MDRALTRVLHDDGNGDPADNAEINASDEDRTSVGGPAEQL